jgi:hypothetical protein
LPPRVVHDTPSIGDRSLLSHMTAYTWYSTDLLLSSRGEPEWAGSFGQDGSDDTFLRFR